MPIVNISIKNLNKLLRRELSRQELVSWLENMGGDVAGYAQVLFYKCPRCENSVERFEYESAPKICEICGFEGKEEFSTIGRDEMIKLELVPSRPDLFDPWGLSRGLKGLMGIKKGIPKYKVKKGKVRVYVDKLLFRKTSYRPFIVCAIVKELRFTAQEIKEIMKLQENLHWALGRDRKKASIGIYDFDKIKPPVYYKTVDPLGVKFSPLGMPQTKLTPETILKEHPKGKMYAHLLKNFKRYPLLVDSQDQVLALPPIINSEETKLTENTKNVFIDVTGLSRAIVEKVLNIVVTSLAECGGEIESVEIVYPDKEIETPFLKPSEMKLKVIEVNELLGIKLTKKEIKSLLLKMRFGIRDEKGDSLNVLVPPYRTDILHKVDLIEDIAIAYGYDRAPLDFVSTLTFGKESKIEGYSNLIRSIMQGLGFQEIITLMLTNPDDHYKKLRMEDEKNYVEVENPASVFQRILRTHLFTGILNAFAVNKTKIMPQKFFEIGDVALLDASQETKTKEERKLCFGVMGPKTGFAEIKAYTEALLRELGVTTKFDSILHPSFIQGRTAEMKNEKGVIGIVGEVHPEVLNNFGIPQPVTLAEIRIDSFVKD